MCEKFENLVFQCAYCRLPHLEPLQQATHGMHETCQLLFDPDAYREMLKRIPPGQPVTGN